MVKTTRGTPRREASLSREQIVDAALAQLDEGGLGSVSMREIAARLGVYPASVQWHVRSRDELLAAVAQRVLADVAPALGRRTWQVWITELMRRCRRQVRKHPNAAQLLTTQLVSNASLPFTLVEGVLTTLASAGLRDNRLIEGYNTVIASMLGFVTMEFTALPPDTEIWWGAYVGMQEQIILSGPLADIGAQILQTRAAARAAHGWIMDIYLMRRTVR